MKRLIALAVLTVLASASWAKLPYAPDFTVSPPTMRVDGTLLGEGELLGMRLYCNGELRYEGAEFSYNSAPGEFAPGSYTCYATAFSAAGESGASNTVGFTVLEAVPLPPVLGVE